MIVAISTEQNSSWKADSRLASQKLPAFMETEGLVPYSQQPIESQVLCNIS